MCARALIIIMSQARYDQCERLLRTDVHKFALALMVDYSFQNTIDWPNLFKQLPLHISFPVHVPESFKLKLVESLVDWKKMSREPELATDIIDIYGHRLDWSLILQHRCIPLPAAIVAKYQSKFDRAICQLLNDII